jgi:hypothetical protein
MTGADEAIDPENGQPEGIACFVRAMCASAALVTVSENYRPFSGH